MEQAVAKKRRRAFSCWTCGIQQTFEARFKWCVAGNYVLKKVAGNQFPQVWVTCVIDARLEERWFWVYFSLSQIVSVQLISQKGFG